MESSLNDENVERAKSDNQHALWFFWLEVLLRWFGANSNDLAANDLAANDLIVKDRLFWSPRISGRDDLLSLASLKMFLTEMPMYNVIRKSKDEIQPRNDLADTRVKLFEYIYFLTCTAYYILLTLLENSFNTIFVRN